MEINVYYKQLVALFESTKKAEEILSEAPYGQEPPVREIPNNIDPYAQQAQPIKPGLPMEDPGLSDTDYLQDEDPMSMMMDPQLSPVEDIIEVSEQQRLIKLLGLYRELTNYTTVFHESLENIDTSTLEGDKNEEIRELKKKILALTEKLRSYIIDRYASETYEKSLYVYILLRTELLTIISLLRKILGVDKNDLKDKNDPKKGKTSKIN